MADSDGGAADRVLGLSESDREGWWHANDREEAVVSGPPASSSAVEVARGVGGSNLEPDEAPQPLKGQPAQRVRGSSSLFELRHRHKDTETGPIETGPPALKALNRGLCDTYKERPVWWR